MSFAAAWGITANQHIVLDIGGTWFRAALRNRDGTLTGLVREQAVNYLSYPDLSQGQLRQRLVEFILLQVKRLESRTTKLPTRASVSMGAAVNGHTGEILDAGPLWGPSGESLDLRGVLEEARPDIHWTVVNDVTALAVYFAGMPEFRNLRKISVMTISTGIACRTIDPLSGRVPLHRDRGVQGEIGHIAVDVPAATALNLTCDCGGSSHLNAYSSGRGIPQVMYRLASALGQPEWRSDAMHQNPAYWVDALQRTVKNDPAAAETLLGAVVEPVARSIVTMLTVDPEVERVVITGGVPSALGEVYRNAMLASLDAIGLYMVSDHTAGYFQKSIVFSGSVRDAGLHGAALAAESTRDRVGVVGASPGDLLSEGRRRVIENMQVTYDITLAPAGAGAALSASLRAMDSGVQPVLLVDEPVVEVHGRKILSELRGAGFDPVLRSVVGGEALKNWRGIDSVLGMFESLGVSRRQHPVVAVGGGALLDAVGLAAGLYRRGVPYVRVPTSLVGLIDAGIGAKVGMNHFGQKNRVGLFFPPSAVILDPAFLDTLPSKYMTSGVAEMVKIAIVQDSELFELLEAQSAQLSDPAFYRSSTGLNVVSRAADAMLSSLQGNLWELDLERPADFGHSISPMLETRSLPAATHGDAVSVDMALFVEIGRGRGILNPAESDRILTLLRSVGLPVHMSGVTAEELCRGLEDTSRHRGGRQRLPIVSAVGGTPIFVSDVGPDEVSAAWKRLGGADDQK